MRRLWFLVLAACGSKSEPSAPPPAPPAPARPAIAEAPGPGPWMKLTDGGGVVLTNPGRWQCASIDGDGKRIDLPITRTSCTVPITDLVALACPDAIGDTKITYNSDGRITSVGSKLTWNGDSIATRDGQPFTIERDGTRVTARYGGTTLRVDTDAQGRIVRVRTWVSDETRGAPAVATIFAYAGDDVVSAVNETFHLPDTEMFQMDMVSCATAASPMAHTRAPLPKLPLGIATDPACIELGRHVAKLDVPAGTKDELAKYAQYVAVLCRTWAPPLRACMTRAKTSAAREACPLQLAPAGPPRPCDVIADHEVALAAVALKSRLTVEDAAARRVLLQDDCTRDRWSDDLRGCTAAATDHAMFLECFRP